MSDVLIKALTEVRNWCESERKSISKGNGSSWNAMQLAEQIDLIDAALAAHPSSDALMEALEIGLDCAQDVAAETHAKYAGYKPHRHKYVDECVQKIEAVIAAFKPAPAAE